MRRAYRMRETHRDVQEQIRVRKTKQKQYIRFSKKGVHKMTLRTIHGFVCEAKKRDSSSAINETFIRKLVKEGRLPCIRSGNRTYLDS